MLTYFKVVSNPRFSKVLQMSTMVNDNEGILSEIEEVMNSLTKNDKIVINSLSFLAEDYKENSEVYPRIVEMIENKLKTVRG